MQRPAAKTVLISPSASPPSTRSFFPQPYRIPDQPSPTKRARVSSTSNPARAPSSSSSASVDPFDFHQAREDSTLRLLNIWSSLDRYTRPIDEDDIVDITTGKVIKDRGVIRGSKKLPFGGFTDVMGDDEDDEDEDEEGESTDELDAFANEGVDDIQVKVDARKVPPVREMDPQDAKDLKEFLEAERRRRETCGSEPDETESDSHPEEAYTETTPSRPRNYRKMKPSRIQRDATLAAHGEDKRADDATPPATRTAIVDSESDDELANWNMDEASMIYLAPKKAQDVKIIDCPELKSPSPLFPPPPAKTLPRAIPDKTGQRLTKPTHLQLQTPPRSHTASSVVPSDDQFFDLPPESTATSPPRTSSPHPSSSSSKRGSSHFNLPQPPSPRISGLKHQVERSTGSPHLDLAKVSHGRGRPPPPKSKSKTELKANEAPAPSTSTPGPPPRRPKLSKRGDASQEPNVSIVKLNKGEKAPPMREKLQAEVVIEKRPPRARQVSRGETQVEEQLGMSASETPKRVSDEAKGLDKKVKYKGKERDKDPPLDDRQTEQMRESDTVVLSSPPNERRPREPPPPSRAGPSSLSLNPPTPKYGEFAPALSSPKKRKRTASAAEIEADSSSDRDETWSDRVDDRVWPNAASDDTPDIKRNSSWEILQLKVVKPSINPKSRRKSRSRQRSESPDQRPTSGTDQDDSSPSSFPEEQREQLRYSSRAPSYFNPPPSGYHVYPQSPYPQSPYPLTPSLHPHHPHPYQHSHPQQQQPPPHLYPPLPDPRAQYIITQAMHQLSALVGGGGWPPPHSIPADPPAGNTPFTPHVHSHYRPYPPDVQPGSSSGGHMYATPPAHHPYPHPHTHTHHYPYMYDPRASTVPPKSPMSIGAGDSRASGGESGSKRKSLVRRSQSRGRRVTFSVEEEEELGTTVDAHDAEEEPSRQSKGKAKAQARSESETDRPKGKGREEGVQRREVSESGSESEDGDKDIRRGRSFMRGQTPGPPSRLEVSEDSPVHGTSRSRSRIMTRRSSRGRVGS